MPTQNRRAFIAGAAALTAAPLLSAKSGDHSVPKLVHHVFFWLKNPDSESDRNALLAGLKTLGEIPSVRGIHVGVPASTEKREVVDNSFHASEILYFDDVAGQDAYQVHPIHKAFVENHSHLWDKVIVYDAVSV
ncbi:Stress responsive A/B Barrel Domain superfamily [Verrucomicrobiia bacterium DG1235]|nr:Stress responsive A/B Barrel Domain superfamily [Verrucomicrobiae bacterium DG1235]